MASMIYEIQRVGYFVLIYTHSIRMVEAIPFTTVAQDSDSFLYVSGACRCQRYL